jgi:NADH:ubiquinone oxidoreductase subunit H
MFILDLLLIIVGILLAIAFFTLLERKLMGIAHFRKGPNKILIVGLLQPIRDAIKLFSKETLRIKKLTIPLFYAGPRVGLLLILTL